MIDFLLTVALCVGIVVFFLWLTITYHKAIRAAQRQAYKDAGKKGLPSEYIGFFAKKGEIAVYIVTAIFALLIFFGWYNA